jgi:predicted nucleotidyltransferase
MQEYVTISLGPTAQMHATPRHAMLRYVKERRGEARDTNMRMYQRRKANTMLYRLINEASIKSKQNGERGVSAKSVKRVSEGVLRGFKG